MRVLAIDPGKSGGLAMWDGAVLQTKPIPCLVSIDEFELAKIIREYHPSICVLESVGGVPQAGAKTSFSFGYGVGLIRGILGAYQIPVEVVMPKTWQKVLWRRYRPEICSTEAAQLDTKKTKLLTFECCKKAFPSVDFRKTPSSRSDVFHDGICDAVGILLWFLIERRAQNA